MDGHRPVTAPGARLAAMAMVAALAVWMLAGCGGAKKAPTETPPPPDEAAAAVEGPTGATSSRVPISAEDPDRIAERWGVEIVAIRPSAADNILDFRYRVLDPEKATFLVDRTIKAYITDQKTGRTGAVPVTAKVGPLRQTLRAGPPPKDRILFILFANPDRAVRSGDKVTVTIGDLQVTDLVVD
jgi:hypothetical protein